MKFRPDEYSITEDSITIKKEAIEHWKEHYCTIVDEYINREGASHYMTNFFNGKCNVLIEMLKHFDTEELNFV